MIENTKILSDHEINALINREVVLGIKDTETICATIESLVKEKHSLQSELSKLKEENQKARELLNKTKTHLYENNTSVRGFDLSNEISDFLSPSNDKTK